MLRESSTNLGSVRPVPRDKLHEWPWTQKFFTDASDIDASISNSFYCRDEVCTVQ